MAFPRRHPRFSLLLASLIFIALLFLLPHSPLVALQPSPGSSEALKKAPPVVYHGVSARVRRAERAYQKMLRGRDALIGKVGPTPRDVALSVILCLAFFSCLFPRLTTVIDFHQTKNHGRHILLVSLESLLEYLRALTVKQGTFSCLHFPVRMNWSV